MLDVSHLCVAYDNTSIIADISFSVGTGETLAITGPSGVGKSTVLHAICGLIRVRSGSVLIDGVNVTNVPTHKRGIGLVSQTGDLFPTMTVFDNVEFGLQMSKTPKPERSRRVRELLDMVGLANLADRNISGLSGGESRRVALARALAPSPRVLLLDEPLTGLDQVTHHALMHDVIRALRETATTAVLVTHDTDEALEMAHRTLTLHPQELPKTQ